MVPNQKKRSSWIRIRDPTRRVVKRLWQVSLLRSFTDISESPLEWTPGVHGNLDSMVGRWVGWVGLLVGLGWLVGFLGVGGVVQWFEKRMKTGVVKGVVIGFFENVPCYMYFLE